MHGNYVLVKATSFLTYLKCYVNYYNFLEISNSLEAITTVEAKTPRNFEQNLHYPL